MTTRSLNRFLATALIAACCGLVSEIANAAPQTIHWKDLRPANQQAGETFSIPQIAAQLPDHGETLSLNLRDKELTLAGFALPVDRDGDLVYQFLLVPWTGACSHMPTPPPNQIVLVTLPKPYKMSKAYEAVSVTGTLKPGMEKSQLYILDGVTMIQSGYSLSRAQVASVERVPDAVALPQANPWKLITK